MLEIEAPAATRIELRGGPETVIAITADARGRCEAELPYGAYFVTAGGVTATVYVAPLAVTRLRFTRGGASITEPRRPQSYVGSPSLHGMLLTLEPATVTDPLDFTGLRSMRLPLVSHEAGSWTDTRYTLAGMSATDAWQPGRAAIFPDLQALSEVAVRDGAVALYLREPAPVWHGEVSSADTGTALASDNLPPAETRGAVQQAERFRWFTRDNAQAGGTIGRRVDLFLSGTAQWASQTAPQVASGADLHSRMLYGNARGRVQVTDRDQLEAHFSGSQIHLSNWGVPAGLEALVGRRMSPELNSPWGFEGLAEYDHLDSVQVGWTRQLARGAGGGALQVRFGFAPMHLDTVSTATTPSRIELEGSAVTGPPPLANLAVRTRHDLEAAWQPGTVKTGGVRQRIAVGGGFDVAKARNRYSAPAAQNLITANGVPAFVVELNTPDDSRDRIVEGSAWVGDDAEIASWLAVDAGVRGDFSRGSVPGGSGRIDWSSAAPRVGLAITPPWLPRLVLRGGYARTYVPMAGRYLDFGDPNSLSGMEYQAPGGGRPGPLLMRFGGAYSTIDPNLRRPYADSFTVAAEASLPLRTFATLRLFRRDEKDRMAALDTGVPFAAYRAVEILDPGPDAIPGTFDDQLLTVYAQDPATFGKDQYLLTNPRGLRELYEGVEAEAGGAWRIFSAQASFLTMKSWGPTNPGDAALENDAGVIGALMMDPNTMIHAAGRAYLDRAFAGKVQVGAHLPRWLGGIEIANVANYLDGLPFARQLLVTGLPQGPLMVATTVRGSPEGGNRSEFVIDWNLRVSREVGLGRGRLRVGVEILNVTNANNRVQESDVSGPAFNLRLPVEIEAARFVRVDARWRF